MKRLVLISALLVLAALAAAQEPFRLVFENAQVTSVLRAISMKTGANIVFVGYKMVRPTTAEASPAPPGQAQLPRFVDTGKIENVPTVTLNVKVKNTEEALRAVTSAAGLVYKFVRGTYVVALHESMKLALENYGERLRIPVEGISPLDAAMRLEFEFPYLTARPSIGQVLVTGTHEDIMAAKEAIRLAQGVEGTLVKERVVYRAKYISAKTAADLLLGLYPGLQVSTTSSEATAGGTMVLTGPKGMIEAALDMLESIDVPTAPTEPDKIYEVYQVKYASAPELKKFLDAASPAVKSFVGPESYIPTKPGFSPMSGATIGGGGIGGGSGSGDTGSGSGLATGGGGGGGTGAMNAAAEKPAPGDRATTLVLYGTSTQIESAMDLLAKLDIEPRQVNVEVRVVDASPDKLEQLGFKWNWNPFSFLEVPDRTTVAGATGTTREPVFGQFSRVPWGINSILDAMIQNKSAKLLASPNVSVVEGHDANIFIGETIRTKVATASGLGTQTVQIAEFPVGIIMLIRPRVNDDGNITMRIHPAVSTITAISGENLPQTSTREADTTVMIKHGETVVIAGLIRDEMTRTTTSVPLLSNFPIIGELFKHRETRHRKSEVMIFITPKIVSSTAPPATSAPVGDKSK